MLDNLKFLKSIFKKSRLSTKEQAHFAKRLAFLVKAGVPILDSLKILRRQTKSKSRSKIFDKIISDVSNGRFLSTSLKKLPNIFGDFAINIIKVGETSGTLDQNLNYLSEELKKKQALKQKIVGAFVYPIFITVATVGLTVLLTVFIFPKIRPIFDSLHVDLPISTKILIFVSDFLGNYGIYLLAGVATVIIAFLVLIKKSDYFHFIVDRLILRVPLFGKITQSYNMTNFCRTLGLLLKSGVRVTEALAITGDTTRNFVYKKECQNAAKSVMQGEKISKYLERRLELFPDIITQMIAIGESTGNLSETLVYLSELYESEVDDITKNLSSSIEPVLMIFMGLLVGFIAVSVITPIYEITQNLHR